MIVLDTNVVSEFSRVTVNANVADWFEARDGAELYLCSTVVMEQIFGAELFLLKSGSGKYYRVFERLISDLFDGRVLEWVESTPALAGKLRARREAMGRPIGVQDAMIAATCLAHGATLATRNRKDFEGLDLRLVNPFEDR